MITSTTFRTRHARDAALSGLLAAEARAQSETGVIAYRIAVDARNPLRTHGLEIYDSEAALRHHLSSPEIHELISATGPSDATLDVTAYQGDLETLNLQELLSG